MGFAGRALLALSTGEEGVQKNGGCVFCLLWFTGTEVDEHTTTETLDRLDGALDTEILVDVSLAVASEDEGQGEYLGVLTVEIFLRMGSIVWLLLA